MVCAFDRGGLVCEVGGDGRGLTGPEATAFARVLRGEYPDAVVALLPAKPSWTGGWPWTTQSMSGHQRPSVEA